jgi:hypothetical protein
MKPTFFTGHKTRQKTDSLTISPLAYHEGSRTSAHLVFPVLMGLDKLPH